MKPRIEHIFDREFLAVSIFLPSKIPLFIWCNRSNIAESDFGVFKSSSKELKNMRSKFVGSISSDFLGAYIFDNVCIIREMILVSKSSLTNWNDYYAE